ncbi:MAG TPA: YbaB/EbfC family nucleoid-associated protein [Actinophytocola sp.]|uniref:YbaB/EbfC family nucleoid-associated protein n=1 Tax=Actinophytocola sp. TaxID=1872138 RepID=UPI002DDC9F5B|nr:YbaB/EbfC family nucleoid-associated protein [Actinophytocola sp.]HEV2781078.1 YbaB/EbfC family nucleoid-associated protein [Actinophytocola sp.]
MSQYSDRLDAEIERADRKIRETGARVAAQIRRSGPVTGRATSQDGAITVTVGPGGRLVDLDIGHAALTMRPEQLAAELVKLAQRATRDANSKLHRSIRGLVDREVTDSLARLGIAPAAEAEDADVDVLDMIRRQQ